MTTNNNGHARYYKLRCRELRKYVFHTVEEEGDVQTVTCLSCGDVYKFHIKDRNKIEMSLWKYFEKYNDDMTFTECEKRPKKRWGKNLLFFRG